ncbi:hypothetical protein IMAU60227_01051 [Lactobacillus helveticus]|nr:hypothetical protein [Lactobacillus helveticus]NRO12274.1 hypothetical protein [Lactobacillus helveticus]
MLLIHRVAISNEYRGMHLASYLLSSLISLHYAERVRNYRVDTFRRNEIVQHLVKDAGFTWLKMLALSNEETLKMMIQLILTVLHMN